MLGVLGGGVAGLVFGVFGEVFGWVGGVAILVTASSSGAKKLCTVIRGFSITVEGCLKKPSGVSVKRVATFVTGFKTPVRLLVEEYGGNAKSISK